MSIFWSVCGGQAFSVMLGVELLFIIVLTLMEYMDEMTSLNFDDIFLRLQCMVILPPEMIFAEKLNHIEDANFGYTGRWSTFWKDYTNKFSTTAEQVFTWLAACCTTLCCCYIPAAFLTTCCCTYAVEDHYIHPRIRIGVSMLEWILIILFGIFMDDHGFVFFDEYGFSIFIVGLVLYLVSSEYLYFMPRFVMPHGVRIRSKWGYAFNGELEELKKMKNQDWDQRLVRKWEKRKDPGTGKEKRVPVEWKPGTSPAMFALANGHRDVVQWLEEQGAIGHNTESMHGLSFQEKTTRAKKEYIDVESQERFHVIVSKM